MRNAQNDPAVLGPVQRQVRPGAEAHPLREEGMFVHLANGLTMCHVAFWFDDHKQAEGFRDALNAACRKHRVHASIVGSYPAELARDVQAEFGSSPGLREAEAIIRRAATALACGPNVLVTGAPR